MTARPIISRLAPTPSGHPHAGNVFNFLLTWLFVRSRNGTLYLRIDDMDTGRCRTAFVESIFRTLDWLQLDWDKGPAGVEDFIHNYSFATRQDYYWSELNRIIRRSDLFYACSCSRKEIAQASDNGLYPQTCRGLRLSRQRLGLAIRVHVPAGTEIDVEGRTIRLDTEVGDFVVWRKDGLPAYQFASLIDDRDIGTTLIVRGEDLRTSSAAQCHLARHCNAPAFCQATFVHHQLILDPSGRKLAKSSAAEAALQAGTPREMYAMAAELLRLPDTATSLNELLALFQLRYPAIPENAHSDSVDAISLTASQQ